MVRGSLLLVGLLLGCAACSGGAEQQRPTDRIGAYFTELNAAAGRGAAAQNEFFRRTQAPDFADRYCANERTTVTERPTLSTVRPDPRWAPDGAVKPAGTVYSVAVLLTAKQAGKTTASQISVARVVDRNGRIYGFSPCAST